MQPKNKKKLSNLKLNGERGFSTESIRSSKKNGRTPSVSLHLVQPKVCSINERRPKKREKSSNMEYLKEYLIDNEERGNLQIVNKYDRNVRFLETSRSFNDECEDLSRNWNNNTSNNAGLPGNNNMDNMGNEVVSKRVGDLKIANSGKPIGSRATLSSVRLNEMKKMRSSEKRWYQKISVEPILFLFMLSVHITMPVEQGLVYQKVCLQMYDKDLCKIINRNASLVQHERVVQEKSSLWLMYLDIALAIPSIVTATYFGSISDSLSQKLPMILANIGACLSAVNYLLCAAYISWPPAVLLLSNFLYGFFGGSTALLSSVFCYLSQISEDSQRTTRMAILEAMLMLGATLGMSLSGVILDHTNFTVTFTIVLSIHVINIIYVIYFVKDIGIPVYDPTTGQVVLEQMTWKKFGVHTKENLTKCSHFKESGEVLVKDRPGSRRTFILLILSAFSVSVLTSMGENTISFLYLRKSPLSFTQTLYGIFRGLKSFLTCIALIGILPILQKYFDISDLTCAIIGTLSKCLGDFMYGFATSARMIFFVPVLGMFGSYIAASVRSYLSKQVAPSEQGKLFAIVASVENVDILVGTLVFNGIYASSLDTMPSLAFYVATALHFFTLPPFMYVSFKEKTVSEAHEPPLPSPYLHSENSLTISPTDLTTNELASRYDDSKTRNDLITLEALAPAPIDRS
ncbi:hypothetical protein SNEBB_001322 [Seison nebaliae]|nr:hypothetical protein SNEBB_001322 [Seison nebaliae]